MTEYRQSGADFQLWNFSYIWMAEPGNATTTTITISWNITELTASPYTTIALYHDDQSVRNMLRENEYIIDVQSGESMNFYIHCEQTQSKDTSTSFIPIVYIFVSLLLVTIYYKKRYSI